MTPSWLVHSPNLSLQMAKESGAVLRNNNVSLTFGKMTQYISHTGKKRKRKMNKKEKKKEKKPLLASIWELHDKTMNR